MSKKKIIIFAVVVFLSLIPFLVMANPPGPLPEDPKINIKTFWEVVLVLSVTVLIECLVGAIVLKIKKYTISKKRFISSLVLANVISYPLFVIIMVTQTTGNNLMGFATAGEMWRGLFLIIIAELFVILLESFIVKLVIRRILSFSQIIYVIFINNLVTCVLGFFYICQHLFRIVPEFVFRKILDLMF